MKAIIIEVPLTLSILTLCITLSLNLQASNFKSMAELIAKSIGKKYEDDSPKKIDKKKIISIDKKGIYHLKWNVLEELDFKKKKMGPSLKTVINKRVKIRGYMIPLDFSAKLVKEFLLVPYIPSCHHVPPPGPNLTIRVIANNKKGVETSYEPVLVTGKLELEEKVTFDANGMGSGFKLTATAITGGRR